MRKRESSVCMQEENKYKTKYKSMNVSGLVSEKINCVLSRVSLFQPYSCCESIKFQTFELSDRCKELNRPNHFQNIWQMLCINPWYIHVFRVVSICASASTLSNGNFHVHLLSIFFVLFCMVAKIHLLTYFVLIWSRNYRCPLVELAWNKVTLELRIFHFYFRSFDITEWHSFYRISMCNEYNWPKNEANLLK